MGGGRRSAIALRSRTTSEKRDATATGCVYVAVSATTAFPAPDPIMHAQRQSSQQLLASVLEQ